MRYIIIGFIVSVIAFAATAANESTYKGQETRDIKVLSQQEIDGYRDGRGMGFAKAAELNNYPGPRHVLDLSDELDLSRDQMAKTRAVYEAMRARAITLGKQLLEKERELDQAFAAGEMGNELLHSLVSDIGMIRAQIRYTHLSAHLEQEALLSREQIQTYNRLRGHGSAHGDQHHH